MTYPSFYTGIPAAGAVAKINFKTKAKLILEDTVGRLRFYRYVDYRKNREHVFWCIATSLPDADRQLIAATGINPVKNSHIGCEIRGKI